MKVLPLCVIKTCKNSIVRPNKPNDGITFHRFPTDDEKKSVWIRIVRYNRVEPDWEPTVFSVVCSLHFGNSDFIDNDGAHSLNVDAVPKKLILPPKIDRRKIISADNNHIGIHNAEVVANLSSYEAELLIPPKTGNPNVGIFTHVDSEENIETSPSNSCPTMKMIRTTKVQTKTQNNTLASLDDEIIKGVQLNPELNFQRKRRMTDEDDDCVLIQTGETKNQQTEEKSTSDPKEVIVFPPMTSQRNVQNSLLLTQLNKRNPQLIQTNTTSPQANVSNPQLIVQGNIPNPQLVAQGNIPNPQAIPNSFLFSTVAQKSNQANLVKSLENKIKQSQLKVKTQRLKINALNLKIKRLENRNKSLKSVIEVLTGEPLELPPIK